MPLVGHIFQATIKNYLVCSKCANSLPSSSLIDDHERVLSALTAIHAPVQPGR